MTFDPMRRCADCRLPSPYTRRCDYCAGGMCDCDVCRSKESSALTVLVCALLGLLCVIGACVGGGR